MGRFRPETAHGGDPADDRPAAIAVIRASSLNACYRPEADTGEAVNRLDENQLLKAHGEVVATASRLIAGRISFVEGVRTLVGLRTLVSPLDHDPDFMLFVAIDSESDHLPGREQRQHCASEWLDRCDSEAVALEHRWLGSVRPACEVLIRRFTA